MNSRKERYFSRRSFIPFRIRSFQSGGSFQFSSDGDQVRAFGRPRYSTCFLAPG
jgi:hypothetical protein